MYQGKLMTKVTIENIKLAYDDAQGSVDGVSSGKYAAIPAADVPVKATLITINVYINGGVIVGSEYTSTSMNFSPEDSQGNRNVETKVELKGQLNDYNIAVGTANVGGTPIFIGSIGRKTILAATTYTDEHPMQLPYAIANEALATYSDKKDLITFGVSKLTPPFAGRAETVNKFLSEVITISGLPKIKDFYTPNAEDLSKRGFILVEWDRTYNWNGTHKLEENKHFRLSDWSESANEIFNPKKKEEEKGEKKTEN